LLHQQQTHADKLGMFHQLGMELHYGTGITPQTDLESWHRRLKKSFRRLANWIVIIFGSRGLNRIRILEVEKFPDPDPVSKILEQEQSQSMKKLLPPPLLQIHRDARQKHWCHGW